MIEDLIFKGKTLEDAIAKACNFFGVTKEKIEFEQVDNGDADEVAICLTENPIMPKKQESMQTDHARYGLLRSDSLPKQPPRQYEHPQAFEESKPAKNAKWQQKRPQENSRQQKNGAPQENKNMRQPSNNRKGKDFSNGRNNRKNFRDNKRPQKPQPRPVTNWQPSDIDTSHLGDYEKNAHSFVASVLKDMELQAEVRPVLDDDRLIMNIDGPDRNILLNRKGEPLIAIQYLVNKIFLGPEGSDQKPVFVDSMGYRVAREEELHDIAIASAEKVMASGREYSLNPMNPYERRQIHMALKDNTAVETVSRGSGYIKRVSIVPAR
jgi:spoIIIJ-associated protein